MPCQSVLTPVTNQFFIKHRQNGLAEQITSIQRLCALGDFVEKIASFPLRNGRRYFIAFFPRLVLNCSLSLKFLLWHPTELSIQRCGVWVHRSTWTPCNRMTIYFMINVSGNYSWTKSSTIRNISLENSLKFEEKWWWNKNRSKMSENDESHMKMLYFDSVLFVDECTGIFLSHNISKVSCRCAFNLYISSIHHGRSSIVIRGRSCSQRFFCVSCCCFLSIFCPSLLFYHRPRTNDGCPT